MAVPRSRARARRDATPWWAWLAGAFAVAGAIGIGVYLARTGKPTITEVPTAAPALTAPAATTTPQHPIDEAATGEATADTSALPTLEGSDADVAQALAGLLGGNGLAALLNPEHVIERIVATIDSLPNPKIAANTLPVRGAQGAFATRMSGTTREIDARNFERYAAYTRIASAIDAKKLVAWYVHFYPLFQQAYRALGHPDGYFNDRLIVVIDDLLATPDLDHPPELVPANATYAFADPTLESRSAGQKLLMRSGPDNEAAIKAKLREIRAALTGGNGPAPAP